MNRRAVLVGASTFLVSHAPRHEGNGTMSGSPDYTLTPNLGLYRPNYDAAAATAGGPGGGLYHNAGAVRVRLT